MIKIEVTGNNQTKKSAKGNDYTLQEAYAAVSGSKYPVRVEIFPPKGQQPYAPGMYHLAPESIKVGEYGKMEINPVLLPISAQQPARA